MQEAADAVAFSSAVITARGMNIIVLLNLMMAAILAIRVAINVAKFGLILAAGIFGAIALIPFMEWMAAPAAAAADGAEVMQNIDNSTKQAIDTALIGLHGAEVGVKYMTPAAAFAGAQFIATKYEPMVTLPSMIFGATVGTGGSGPGNNGGQGGGGQGGGGQGGGGQGGGGQGGGGQGGGGQGGGGGFQIGLPIVDGSLKKLCAEAFKANSDLLETVMPAPIGKALGGALDMLHGILAGIGVDDAFCELGQGGDPQQALADASNKIGGDTCNTMKTQACTDATTADQTLGAVYAKYGWTSDGVPPDNWATSAPAGANAEITSAQQNDADKQAKCKGFDSCASNINSGNSAKPNGSRQAALDKVNAKPKAAGVSGNKQPAMVDPNWHDGIRDAQIVSVVFSTTGNKFVDTAPKFEQIAAGFYHQDTVKYTSPGSAILGLDLSVFDPTQEAMAQAEFFYDCTGEWKPSCNNDEEAMWNFRWRSRLRLVNPDALNGILKVAIQGEEVAMKTKIGVDLFHYGQKRVSEGLNLNTAIEAVTPIELVGSLALEPLTLH
jgi:hypothetical protein